MGILARRLGRGWPRKQRAVPSRWSRSASDADLWHIMMHYDRYGHRARIQRASPSSAGSGIPFLERQLDGPRRNPGCEKPRCVTGVRSQRGSSGNIAGKVTAERTAACCWASTARRQLPSPLLDRSRGWACITRDGQSVITLHQTDIRRLGTFTFPRSGVRSGTMHSNDFQPQQRARGDDIRISAAIPPDLIALERGSPEELPMTNKNWMQQPFLSNHSILSHGCLWVVE